ncbi:MAG: protein kinase [Acidobacteriota bacterium]
MQTAKVVKGEILIVDDEPANLELLLKILEEQDYKVRITVRSQLVMASLQLSLPDLILLDIGMPEVDGYQVCQMLKSNTHTCDIPIIFISAMDEVIDKVKAFEVGGADYITKPFQIEEVLARTENQLKIARLQKEMQRKNQELTKRNAELIELYSKANLIFAALSETLAGWVLDEKYRLECKIGAGAHGAVYRALHLALNRPVAIKIFQPGSEHVNPDNLYRFRMEGISASLVNHPNAVSILDFGISEEYLPYLVMELLTGHTLGEELRRKGLLPAERCAEILIPVCNVLATAHDLGIVHRDIKPENIFLHHIKEEVIVKVVDFGIAKPVVESYGIEIQHLTATGRFIGTPVYMAPERFNSKNYNGKADVYSVGMMLYEMLTGRLPFDFSGKDIMEIAIMHWTNEPTPLREIDPHIPEQLDHLIMRALAKDANQRPTARELAQEFVQSLEKIKHGQNSAFKDRAV